jgi:hypothetical protein
MPITLGFLLLEAAGVTEIAGFAVTAGTASIVGNVALATAAIGGSLLLNRTDAPKPQDGQQTVRQAAAQRRRAYGLVKCAGPILFSEASNGRRYQIIALNQGEIDAFQDHFFDQNGGDVDGSGVVTSGYRLGDHHYAQIFTTKGTDADVAFEALTTAFPTLWTSAHQGNGIAKTLTIFEQPKATDFTSVYPGGVPPVYRAVLRSAKVWDPRDGTQTRNDKASWKYSTNSALIALDYHRVPDGMGLAVFDDILFTDAAINEDWIPSANICDEAMLLKDGVSIAPRYACSGSYELSSPPKTVLASMLSTCDGQTYQRSDGAIGLRVGKTIAPTVTLDDDDIVGYDSLRRGPPNSLVPVNTVTAKYTASLLDFQENDAQPWIDEDALAAAGKTESRDIDLRWVPVHPQARRLMKLALARFTPEWTGKIITGLSGLKAWGERYIRVKVPELDIDQDFEVTSFDIDPASLKCSIGISSMDQSALDWDAATEEGSEPDPPPVNEDSSGIEAPINVNATVSGRVITITWDAAVPAFVTAQAQYGVSGSGNWFDASVDSSNLTAGTPVLLPNHYDVQVRFVSGSRHSDWAPFFNINVT